MKVKDHRQMMRSLTDPLNIPKLRALIETHPVLTQEEFKARQNMAEGGVPQLVQPGPGRPGYKGNPEGNPLLGTKYTGTQHKGKIFGKNKERLDKLKEIIKESNLSYTKNITAHDALVKAGWKDGYQSIGTTQKIRPEVAKAMKKLLTTQEKIDNYVNNVILGENALMKDFRNPAQHIAKKFGVSKSFVDKWAAKSKVWADNKKLFSGLANEFSFNKYKTLPDGTPRLIADYSVIRQNKLPTAFQEAGESLPHKFIMDSAHRHNQYAKNAGKTSQVRFIDKNYELLPRSEWKFIKNNKLYSMDPALDDVVYQGTTYKNNYLNHVDAPKLYKNDFGDVYKAFDDLDVYMDTMVEGPDGKPIKLDTLLRRDAFKKTGKQDFLRRRFAELDHFDIKNKPFSDIRLLDRQTNVRAGIIKRFDKYKKNPKLLNKTLTDIGYLNRDKDVNAFINRMSKNMGVKVVPSSGGGALYSFPANLPAMFKKMGALPRKVLGLFGADLGFYYLDKWNEMSKGKSEKEAAGIALNNATLGAYNNKTYIEGLKKTAKEMGIDPRAFENVYKMNEKMAKVQKEHKRYQGMIEKLKKREASPERDRTLASIENAYNNWQEGMEPEIDKWVQGIVDDISISKTGGIASPLELSKAAGSITDDEWYGSFGNLQKVALEKLRQEKAAAYDMQSRQVDPEAGKIGNILNIFPFSLSPLERAKEQGRIDDMVAFDPKELYRYNLARGLDPDAPITQAAYENLMYEHPGLGFNKGGRASYLDGGIVSLLKK